MKRITALSTIILVAFFLGAALGLTGCGGGKQVAVTGTIVDKHVEQEAVTYIKVGTVLIPSGGGARYVLVIDGDSGGAVKVSAKKWASYKIGEQYP